MGPFVQVVLGQIISLFGNAALRFVLPLILLRQHDRNPKHHLVLQHKLYCLME